MADKLFIERFEGSKGQAEVFEQAERDAMGIERITYLVVFGDQTREVPSMGEASVLASDLAGDKRFSSGA